MSFKILLLSPDAEPSWPEKLRRAVPGIVVRAFSDPQHALDEIADADAAYGTVPPQLFARAAKLRWICAARAGLGGAWASRFNGTVREKLSVRDHRGLVEFDVLGDDASMSIPTPEHYLPLIYSVADGDQLLWGPPGGCGAAVGQIDDLALVRPIDRGMRLFDKTLQAFRQPMVPARLPALAVHSLLHHDPSAIMQQRSPSYGGRSVFGWERPAKIGNIDGR
jgi:hypothetical protein